MKNIIPGLMNAAPAVAVVAGTAPMVFSKDVPDHVRYGGACLMAIGLILTDLQTGRKSGLTDKFVERLRKIPGLKDADEGTLLGILTMVASGFLTGGAIATMHEEGISTPEMLKATYNAGALSASAAVEFAKTRTMLERYIGKEIIFNYPDENGTPKKTSISPSRLFQQLALITGSAGIMTYGTMVHISDIQFTGLMFLLSSGLSIRQMFSGPTAEMHEASLKLLHAATNDPNMDPKALAQEVDIVRNRFRADAPQQPTVNGKDLASQAAAAIMPVIEEEVTTGRVRLPEKDRIL